MSSALLVKLLFLPAMLASAQQTFSYSVYPVQANRDASNPCATGSSLTLNGVIGSADLNIQVKNGSKSNEGGCSGKWLVQKTGNWNAFRIHKCSKKCICFTQYTTKDSKDCGQFADAAKNVGYNIKEACSDKCMKDCDAPNCEFTHPAGKFDITRLKLDAGFDGELVCPPEIYYADADFRCDTTAMDPTETQRSRVANADKAVSGNTEQNGQTADNATATVATNTTEATGSVANADKAVSGNTEQNGQIADNATATVATTTTEATDTTAAASGVAQSTLLLTVLAFLGLGSWC
eukprot:TRINITY_DN815_c0_g1_i8.p1 TRINITY_DN815_c0_g1~~TRINITY_DN815_c0_g1_i8.p1  ORF type:complete len:293 (-),score=61.25 TRINITY_DN815_c0_g1_i8:245-1123(-)